MRDFGVLLVALSLFILFLVGLAALIERKR